MVECTSLSLQVHAMNRLLERLEVAWNAIVVLFTLAAFIGFPAWLLYNFIAPFFGGDALGHFKSVLIEVLKIAAVAIGISAFVMLVGRLSERWRAFRIVLRALAYLLLVLIIVSSLARCISEGPDQCVPSRYIDC